MMTTDLTHPSVRFNMGQCIGSLGIEINTGMRHSQGSVLKLVQTRYGIKAKTKKKALDELKALYKETYGTEYGANN